MDAGPFALVALRVLKDLLYQRWRIRVTTREVGGRTTIKYGFPQNSLKVTVANRGNAAIQIRDVRLMFSRRFGIPLREAPPTFTHPGLPAMVEPFTAESWYFPAETIAVQLQSLSSRCSKEKHETKLRPRIATTTGSVYRGRNHHFSMDVNAHW